MYLSEFLFHIGFTNTVSSNKTLVRNTYFIFTIGWYVQKVIANFIKDIDPTIIQDTRRQVMLNPSLKKEHLRSNEEYWVSIWTGCKNIEGTYYVQYLVWNGQVSYIFYKDLGSILNRLLGFLSKDILYVYRNIYIVYIPRIIFFLLCLLWKTANKVKPKVSFIQIKYFGITCFRKTGKWKKATQCSAL